ncbi:DUF2236 domain-containing protein [Allosaccharopolyspora coralli]|uniref:DUF2236 domain-containing protein n=1 Tax=Allosaccharopolyspora coralli TaxID=2665642 RepID=A0A5Q3QCL1_9PSEU|nr:DUF2236 domain-containing protein [Allosaccharopolyspora coralli]
MPHARRDAIYTSAAPLGTTLPVPRSLWPADVQAFDRYWNETLGTVRLGGRPEYDRKGPRARINAGRSPTRDGGDWTGFR